MDTSTYISLKAFFQFLQNPSSLKLELFDLKQIQKSYEFLILKEKSSKIIYGYNTGFGALGNVKIPKTKLLSSQKNLIYHLATGIGNKFEDEEALSILLARIVSLSKGFSGISLDSFKKLISFFQNEVIAHIPQIGTVGASGDLTPLSHLALSYMGESYIYYKEKTYKKNEFFKQKKISPLKLKGRDGLALVNGTSASLGISALNIYFLQKAFQTNIFYSFIYSEIFELSVEYYSEYFYNVKRHEGFLKVSQVLFEFMKSSPRIKKEFLYETTNSQAIQPCYSLRAVVQILGSVYDFLKNYYQIIEIELNSVSDNPLFFAKDDKVVHGANFYGSHLSLVNDGMRLLVHQIANLSERRIAKLTDSSLNSILPKFLVTKLEGINSGLMGAQVTSTALLSEIRNLSLPSSIHSIPTNANNQDIIPLSCTSARLTRDSLELLFFILAIEGICLAQAVEILKLESFSYTTKKFWNWIRKTSKFLEKDRPLSEEIQILKEKLKKEELFWIQSSLI